MPQEQNGIKIIQGFGVVAAFGLLTMSSNIACNSYTTMIIMKARIISITIILYAIRQFF